MNNIVITGGAGLIGKSFSHALAESGANIIIADWDYEKAKAIASEINVNHKKNKAFALKYDATSADSIQTLLDKSISLIGNIDTLINNVYIKNKNYGKDFFSVDLSSFNENLASNVGAYFETSKIFSKHFLDIGHGNIINIASIYGTISPKFNIYKNTKMTMPVEYSAIKSAVIHLTKYMAQYFKDKQIRVNCISPGGIFDNQPQEFIDRYREGCINKGMLDTQDLTGTLLFLVSNHSKFINGQNIIIDDGFSL